MSQCDRCKELSEQITLGARCLLDSNGREEALIEKCRQLLAERDSALNRVDELERTLADERYNHNTRD